MWYNNITSKKYVGSGYNLGKRINDYFFSSKLMIGHRKINNSILKYSLKNFTLIILEIFNTQVNKEEYLKREQYYIDTYKPEYNILPIAGSSLGFKHSEKTINQLKLLKKGFKHSEKTKKLLSHLKKGENNPFFGKKHTPEALEKISNARKGDKNPLYGKPLRRREFIAQQHKDKTESLNHMSKKVFVYKFIYNEYFFLKEFETIQSVARFIGCSKTTISRYCKTGKIYYYNNIFTEGYFFSFFKL